MSIREQDLLRPLDVSRETCDRLKTYEMLLRKWQKVKNLVSPSTLDSIWERHFRDSLQLRKICPLGKRWVDIGSGAGFPGLVIAIDLANVSEALVHLVESDNRKCAFLREVARETGAHAIVDYSRAENIVSNLADVDVVTARAVAPLDNLVEMAWPLIERGAIGLFPKGRDYPAELTRLSLPSTFKVDVASSLTDDQAAIILVQGPNSRTLVSLP